MEKKSKIKKIRQFVALTSNTLLDTFLSDTAENRQQEKISVEMRDAIKKAARQHSLVVLQVDNPDAERKFETISGWLVAKNKDRRHLLIKLQKDKQQIRMVPLESVRKISILAPNGHRENISR
ncbi:MULTISPECIES: hypothetical protein [Enterococcus]|uniref:hypothetical protein n=1 Tax=Enterococcus TaxID=1350 RepID=UPI00065E4354|nr:MULTISPECIES: hypothetical protein [Enterococcus]KAF1300925.1 hypothetical protein BAU16_11130 [Enterococcus sp. JM9B]